MRFMIIVKATAESEAAASWTQADEKYDFARLKAEADDFNRQNKRVKKGVALMPVCFGISFTKTPMNQARSLVHIYTDGSVAVSTGAVEMGQGVNTKIAQVAAREGRAVEDAQPHIGLTQARAGEILVFQGAIVEIGLEQVALRATGAVLRARHLRGVLRVRRNGEGGHQGQSGQSHDQFRGGLFHRRTPWLDLHRHKQVWDQFSPLYHARPARG